MISIRKANCDDGQTVSQLLHSRYSFSTEDEAAAVFTHECEYQHYRIAEVDGKPVGLISWRPQGTERHGVVELTRIAVAPDVEDRAFVKELLFDQMIAEADYYYKQHGKHLRKVFSMIHADNKDVKEFFQNKGMHQEAILRNHFHRGTDELVYSIFLAA
ncbi:MAG: GNAT family N-acetyltransferase [Candidatus Kerfeldbacteria bacterium]|nr:GNAT family N-acetyltransferase [Candidatus Kerfeldbacteria bacterium]